MGLTTNGFEKPRLQDIKADLEASFKAVFGPNIDVNELSPLGQIIGIVAERMAIIYEAIEATYYSQYPATASGDSLSRAVGLTGLTRKAGTKSSGTVTISGNGVDTVIVPEGFQIAVVGDATNIFETTGDLELTAGGAFDVGVQSLEVGTYTAVAGTLTEIVNPTFGIVSVTNTSDITPGTNVETDTELRLRQQEELQTGGEGTVEGIRNALLELAFVDQAIVIENETDVTDGDGRPPHSFEAIIADDGVAGNNPVIAELLWNAKPAGIQTFESITESITDSQGLSHDINFSRATDVPVYIRVGYTINTNANEGPVGNPATVEAEIKAALVAYGTTLKIGYDVRQLSLVKAVASVTGVVVAQVQLSTSAIPGSGTYPADISDITIDVDEAAKISSDVLYMAVEEL